MICVGYEDRNVILSDNKNESFSNISNCMHRKFNYESWEIKELKSDKLDFILLCTDGISDDIKAENRAALPPRGKGARRGKGRGGEEYPGTDKTDSGCFSCAFCSDAYR